MIKMTNPVGRPLKFKTVESMQVVIDEYFESVTHEDDNGVKHSRPTVTGLAYALDIDRSTLIRYEVKGEFRNTIKRAKQLIAIALESHLYGNNVTGAIFNLKNNFGWKDKTEQEINIVEKPPNEMTDAELDAAIKKASN